MKTLVRKTDNSSVRRKSLKRQSFSNLSKTKEKKFVLHNEDYEELIEIKRKRDQKQRERSTLFFLLGLCITLGSLIIVFNWKFKDDVQVAELMANDQGRFEEVQDIPLTEQPPPPPPQVLQAPRIVEVSDEVIIEEVEVNLDVEVTEEMVVEEVEFAPIEEEVAEEIFEIVENSPEPVGGIGAFYSYVGENLKYPATALRMEISGRVFVKFVVNDKGEISRVHVVKGIGGGCDEEAVRVLESAPKWNPGKQRGKPVSVWMTLPITFKLMK